MKTDKNECTNDPIDIKKHLTLKQNKKKKKSKIQSNCTLNFVIAQI